MSQADLTVRYNRQQPPILLLALSGVLEFDKGQLSFVAKEDSELDVFVELLVGGDELPQRMSELEAAKRISLLTSLGHTLYPDTEGEAILSALLTVLADSPFSGSFNELQGPTDMGMKLLNNYLSLRTFLVGNRLSLVDLGLYAYMRRVASAEKTGAIRENLQTDFPAATRWYGFLQNAKELRGPVERALNQKNWQPKPIGAGSVSEKKKGEGAVKTSDTQASYEGKLEGAMEGCVVTRFPPEPSGYLHIGHAKAALLNGYFASKYKGRLIFRFDDTNPAKENGEFEESILEDTAMLGVRWDKITHTSDYFGRLQQLCTSMIEKGIFYVDNTPVECMREQRAEGVESTSRNLPIEESLQRWQQMVEGSHEGQKCCVRAKIDMQSKNKCMRDPVMFRCVVEPPHHRLGRAFKAYPTYDFACPVVDAEEGVTHALRTNEYADRIPQYHWVQKALGLRKVAIYEFSRLCFVRTVLSKRKLKWFVDGGLVEGWDDPRMPTVRGRCSAIGHL